MLSIQEIFLKNKKTYVGKFYAHLSTLTKSGVCCKTFSFRLHRILFNKIIK